jgi:hypothetical protein
MSTLLSDHAKKMIVSFHNIFPKLIVYSSSQMASGEQFTLLYPIEQEWLEMLEENVKTI